MSQDEDLKREQDKLASEFFKLVQQKGAERSERALATNAGPTAKDLAAEISAVLKDWHPFMLNARQGLRLDKNNDSVMVTYASVPKGSPELDALNAKTNPKWHITAAPGEKWFQDGPAPAKLKIEHFSGSIRRTKSWDKADKVTFRAKTGTPAQIVKYLADFFAKNREAFLP